MKSLCMIVAYHFSSRPLWRLCEFEGKPLPPDYKSDCYQDIDESDYACKEKYRIMVSIHITSGILCFNMVPRVYEIF